MKHLPPLLLAILLPSCAQPPKTTSFSSKSKAQGAEDASVNNQNQLPADKTPEQVPEPTEKIPEYDEPTPEPEPEPEVPIEPKLSIPTAISGLQLVSQKNCVTDHLEFGGCVDAVDVKAKFEAISDEIFVMNFTASNKCLDLFNSVATDGADVFGWECSRTKPQQWKINKVTSDTFRVESVQVPGKCLRVAKKDGKDQLLTIGCSNSVDQVFKFTSLASLANSVPKNYGADTAPSSITIGSQVVFADKLAGKYSRVFADNLQALYVSPSIDRNAVDWVKPMIEKMWTYTVKTYGPFNNQRLYYFLKAHDGGSMAGTAAPSNSDYLHYHNAIAIYYSPEVAKSSNSTTIDLTAHELHHVVVGGAMNTFMAPGPQFWGDSSWAEIYQYDLYANAGYPNDAKRWYEEKKENKHFKNMWWPMYSKFGKTQLLQNWFKTLKSNWPVQSDHFYQNPYDMNLGEFALFWSGAAKTDARPYVKAAFDWNSESDAQFEAAKKRFPNIKY